MFWSFQTLWAEVVALMIILIMLVTAWLCYWRIQTIRMTDGLTIIEQVVYGCAFAIYSGWLTCATCLNFIIVIQQIDNPFSQEQWFGILVLATVFGIFSANAWINKEPFLCGVCCWAFSWIAVEQCPLMPISQLLL